MFYTRILPELRKFDNIISVPKCYYSNLKEGVIILENLKIPGFEMMDKTKGKLHELHTI